MEKELNLKEVLTDVRAAYRILHDYQRRVLDTVDYTGKFYNRNYYRGTPKFSDRTPNKNDKSLNRWAWDWLNLYFYEFAFDSFYLENKTYHFSILLVSDTGYSQYSSNKNQDEIKFEDKTNVQLFAEAHESETKLIFIAGENKWNSDDVVENDFTSNNLILSDKKVIEDNEGKMVFKSYNLELFLDEESTNKCLKDFNNYCKNNGVLVDNNFIKTPNA